MGVTIESKNYAIDLGYRGFFNLRCRVAKLAAGDIGEHYEKLSCAPLFGEDRKIFFKEYDEHISELAEKYNGEMNHVLDFIYKSDCGGTISPEHCKSIWKVIKDYDDNILYGYAGRKDCAKFKDFKNIVKDCIDSNCEMEWF